MTTPITDFYRKECDLIDPSKINAYLEIKVDEEDPSTIVLDTSWGETKIDLAPIVKANETVTTLYLSPEDDPNCLVFEREDGEKDCISGDDLSRIISMTKLKDVDQNTNPTTGDVFIYDGTTKTFKTFNLGDFVSSYNTQLGNLIQRISTLEGNVSNLIQNVNNILDMLTKPEGIPNDAVITWGNINLYSDNTNNNVKTSGLYTHNPSTNRSNDEYFA